MDEALDNALAQIRADPNLLARYDVTGDGELDDQEWELVRRMVALELRTAQERRTTWSLDMEPTVLRDRFEVVGLLGRGGQAFTYLARDQDNDQTHVVVKELAIRVAADWKSVELFEREAEVLERLTHPRIPRYIDAFHLDDAGDGVRFMLVQDFVDGEDLGSFLAGNGRWTESDAVRRMAEVCDILDYLHNKSPAVIHRDIKPSNLIVGRDGHLYLVDFGAVQSVVPATVGGSTIIGTSGYVPMEQYMGHAEPASDLYALGATVVHLLSGTHPADLPFKRSRLQIAKHLNVHPSLLKLLTSMLSPDVDERPETAAAVASALRALEPQQPEARQPAKPAAPSLTSTIDSVPDEDVIVDKLERIPAPTPSIQLIRVEPPESGLARPVRPSSVSVTVQDGQLRVTNRPRSAERPVLTFVVLAIAVFAPVFGVVVALSAFLLLVFAGMATSRKGRLELDADHWQIFGARGWRRLRQHGVTRLFGEDVVGTTGEIATIAVRDSLLEIETDSGDVAFLLLPKLTRGEERWLEDEIARGLDSILNS